jgi:hypothetical protein
LKKPQQKNKQEGPIEQQIKKTKSDKELYDVLLPYSQMIELKPFIKELEENIYMNGTHTIDKKRLQEIFSKDEL